MVALPVGEVIINEQTSSVSGNTGSITVNALHVSIPGVADVVVSSAHADVTCQAVPACIGRDFVTGSGWILGPSGAKANFGVAGGTKQDGTLFGHLEFIDHGSNGPKVHGTAVTNYTILDAKAREIDGAAEVNGQDGFTYRVTVTDNGKRGTNDIFSIQLFDSSGKSFYSAGGNLGGGDIQLHQPC